LPALYVFGTSILLQIPTFYQAYLSLQHGGVCLVTMDTEFSDVTAPYQLLTTSNTLTDSGTFVGHIIKQGMVVKAYYYHMLLLLHTVL